MSFNPETFVPELYPALNPKGQDVWDIRQRAQEANDDFQEILTREPSEFEVLFYGDSFAKQRVVYYDATGKKIDQPYSADRRELKAWVETRRGL